MQEEKRLREIEEREETWRNRVKEKRLREAETEREEI